jgi:hypothetical protein
MLRHAYEATFFPVNTKQPQFNALKPAKIRWKLENTGIIIGLYLRR